MRTWIFGLILAASLAANAWAAGTYLGSIAGFRNDQYTLSGTSCTVSSSGSGGCSGAAKGDCGTIISTTSSSAVTVTLPQTISVGCSITFYQKGAGLVSLTTTGAATINSIDGFTKSAGQKAMFGVTTTENSGGNSAYFVFFGRGA